MVGQEKNGKHAMRYLVWFSYLFVLTEITYLICCCKKISSYDIFYYSHICSFNLFHVNISIWYVIISIILNCWILFLLVFISMSRSKCWSCFGFAFRSMFMLCEKKKIIGQQSLQVRQSISIRITKRKNNRKGITMWKSRI